MAPPVRWVLTLYVSGASPQSARAVENVRRICDEELAGRVDLEVVDVNEAPALVVSDQVLAVPTLVKRLPGPLRRLVGDLSDASRVRVELDLAAVPTEGEADHPSRKERQTTWTSPKTPKPLP